MSPSGKLPGKVSWFFKRDEEETVPLLPFFSGKLSCCGGWWKCRSHPTAARTSPEEADVPRGRGQDGMNLAPRMSQNTAPTKPAAGLPGRFLQRDTFLLPFRPF